MLLSLFNCFCVQFFRGDSDDLFKDPIHPSKRKGSKGFIDLVKC